MDTVKNKINYLYYHLFNMKVHPFFSDISRVQENSIKYREWQKSIIKKYIPYEKKFIGEPIERTVKYENISFDKLKELNNESNKINNFNKIFKLVVGLSNYFLKSNIENENKLLSFISKQKKINILIIGAGPIGLYLCLYLHIYYNISHGFNTHPKVNIILYDNRIHKPGFRKPYNRTRTFSTSSKFLSLALTKLYSMYKNNYITINIYVLEYLLYVKVFLEYKIPILYEDYDWNKYKKIISQGNIKVVFDCTGGRLNTDIFKNVDDSWLKNINLVDKKLNKKLEIFPEKNIVHLVDYKEEKFKQNHFYGSIIILEDNNLLSYKNKLDIDIMNSTDLKFLNSIKRNLYNYKSLIDIIKNIKDPTTRNYLFNSFDEINYKNLLFKFDVWAIYIRHTIQPCEVFDVNKKKILYIKAGDTLFHSHFIIGSGLNRTIKFAVKCANYLIDIN